MGWGGVLTFMYMFIHHRLFNITSSYLRRYVRSATGEEPRQGEQKLPFADRCVLKLETL